MSYVAGLGEVSVYGLYLTPYDKERQIELESWMIRIVNSELRLRFERKRGLRMDGCPASIKLSSFVRF